MNKRLLSLIEELQRQLEGYFKCMKLIKVVCVGSEQYREEIITEMKRQISVYVEKKKVEDQLEKEKIEKKKK